MVAKVAVVACAVLLGVPGVARAQSEPFRDPSLPMSQRIDDLMGRLTLDEKIAFLHQYQPAVPRLGIGVFKAGTEALHDFVPVVEDLAGIHCCASLSRPAYGHAYEADGAGPRAMNRVTVS